MLGMPPRNAAWQGEQPLLRAVRPCADFLGRDAGVDEEVLGSK